MTPTYTDRFGGIGRLYGVSGLERLSCARVCVVGIGGVGTWVAEALARSGIGALTLVDLDDICITNTNRQIHALTDNVGQMKVTAMRERVLQINPECDVQVVEDFVTGNNMAAILAPDDQYDYFDYVVDCIDSVKSKAALLAFCKRRKIRVVTTGAAGGQIDPTQIQIADLNKTTNDPLARKVRSLLRREYGFSRNPSRNYSIPCVFSTEQLVYPQPDGSVCQMKSADSDSTRLDCASGFGSATMVTGTFGFVAASRVVKRIATDAGKKG
ncbi:MULTISPECIES: tRNA cyclic N6-threonylcarbamoyladenosine(37) synthase TcdA [unclassified Oceanobacter]|uniref:tRNA cyclic N6-threonylcarbamoyladenosine(37) synthase TcdA n=1 Tax=unclassified Oceanobacter TaxID=2620260 RepID=UPI002736DDDB|nr:MULTISPECIES: tRNA cyclic N6-threonylcarbamoyladenosine(37) synthase TcdA [unclassified Oceanobacter]MDP2610568.1 tRNA cyclic N6-threonylcarbamoyladenosine(37) synthase TcdA [Oceanobacter sp. 1_MG-2023]MDP2613823.1 tRNA cyclic N6-threonylcarbamoyladenosine(37) synthase TcdA [Oceanobacter sp. 2_MG-2023]